jgi:hypothetical protein
MIIEENGAILYERPHALPIFQELRPDGSYRAFPVEKVIWEREQVTVRLHAHGNAILVMAQPYFPGWQAFADGRPIPLIRVDISFPGVRLQGKEREILFRYNPKLWRNSWWLPPLVKPMENKKQGKVKQHVVLTEIAAMSTYEQTCAHYGPDRRITSEV